MDIRILLVKGKPGGPVKDGLVWFTCGWATHTAHIQIKINGKWVDVPATEIEKENMWIIR
jgi:hypothetical protein